MAILGNILGNLLGKADTIIDEVITSQEEKLKLKNELQKIIQEQEALIEQEVTKRWESDNLQSSWLPRNIRPLVLAWLVVSTTLLIFRRWSYHIYCRRAMGRPIANSSYNLHRCLFWLKRFREN